MKKNIIMLFCSILILTITSCKEKYEPIGNRLYISEASKTNTKKVSVNIEGNTNVIFTVRLADMLEYDMHATLEIDENMLLEYNAKNSTAYEVLPSQYYSFERNVIIKSGKTEADATNITITPFQAEDGVKYAIPIRVIGDGTIAEERTAAQYLLLLEKPWSQSVPYLSKSSEFSCNPIGQDWNLDIDEFTIEFWMNFDGFSFTNQAVAVCEAFYIRLGNANGQVKENQMQINIYTVSGDNNKCFFSGFDFLPNTWTHVAIVYDAASSQCYFYTNGNKNATVSAVGGAPLPIKTFKFSSGKNGYNNRMFAQMRLWKRALSQTEIQANMSGSIAPTSDMIGYWKMNEDEGTVLKDCSGNNHDAVLSYGEIIEWRKDQYFVK